MNIFRTETCRSDHLLDISEVQRMASIADLREQMILEVLLLGLRVSDASRLEREPFDRLDKEPPVPLMIYASREGTIYRTYISAEFQELLRLYLPTLGKKEKYLFPGKRKGSHIDNDVLNQTIQRLAKKAQIKINGNLRWHVGRKLVLGTGAELGINMWSLKALTGKTISADMATYLEGLKLKDNFIKLHSVLRLKARKASNVKIEDLEAMITMTEKAFGKFLRQMLIAEGVTQAFTEKKKKKVIDWTKMTDRELIAWYAKRED